MKSQKLCKQPFFLILFHITLFFLISTPVMAKKSVYGYLEPVTIYPDEVPLTAKLDTGAVTASISAQDIHVYEKEGEEYVKFKVAHPEIEKTLHYNLPVARHAKIKKRASEKAGEETHHSRPEVNIRINFDGKPYKIRVNLIDRSHFSTPMLLGRKALEKVGAIVDGTVKNTLLD